MHTPPPHSSDFDLGQDSDCDSDYSLESVTTASSMSDDSDDSDGCPDWTRVHGQACRAGVTEEDVRMENSARLIAHSREFHSHHRNPACWYINLGDSLGSKDLLVLQIFSWLMKLHANGLPLHLGLGMESMLPRHSKSPEGLLIYYSSMGPC